MDFGAVGFSEFNSQGFGGSDLVFQGWWLKASGCRVLRLIRLRVLGYQRRGFDVMLDWNVGFRLRAEAKFQSRNSIEIADFGL